MKEGMRYIPIDRVTYHDGSRIKATPHIPEWKQKTASKVAVHEAIHSATSEVVIQGSVDGASTTPGKDYLGITYINRMSAEAAVAPHAEGCDGTGHDLRIVEHMGVSVSAASSVARGIVSEHQDEIQAIAYALDQKSSLTGHEIRSIMHEVQEGVVYDVSIISETGEEKVLQQKSPTNLIPIFAEDLEMAA